MPATSYAIRFDQRNAANTAYNEVFASGSNIVIGTDSTGNLISVSTIPSASFAHTASALVPTNDYTVNDFNSTGISTINTLHVYGSGSFDSVVIVTDKTQSPNNYTLGSVTTQGGLGVAKNISVGGNVYVTGILSGSVSGSLAGTSSWSSNAVIAGNLISSNNYAVSALTASNTLTNFFFLNNTGSAPSSSASSGTFGEIRIDNNFIYIYSSARWHRVAHSSW